MQVKRYEVSSMNEAMTRIKNDLGPDAIILSARKIRSGKQDAFEVMAARDDNSDPEAMTLCKDRTQNKLRQDGCQKESDVPDSCKDELREIRKLLESFHYQKSLAGELAEIKETMNSFFDVLGMRKGRVLKDMNSKVYLHLLANGFSRSSACHIVDAVNQKIPQKPNIKEEELFVAAQNHIGSALTLCRSERREKRVKMFIGPTGVGKTTTLAKLAARYALQKKKRVGLISADNFRIAAAEQLGTYARIMGLPMEKASTPESFAKALRMFADRDVILVDTPGRAHPDESYLLHLQQALPDQSIETNLLVAANGSEDHLRSIVSRYSVFTLDHMIITKVDESGKLGMLYDIITRAKKPVTYLTCGQNVPQDIEEATAERMALLMLKGASVITGDETDFYAGLKKE